MKTLSNRTRVLLVAVAIAAGTMTAAAPAQATWTSPPRCGDWQVETVAQGLEQLENLESDGSGGFYLSGDSKVYHVDAAVPVRTVLDNMAAPGGLQLNGSILSFLTRQDGRLWQLDTETGQLTSVAEFAGNGLLRLPDGDLLTTWVGTEGGPSKGVSRFEHDTGTVVPNWSTVPGVIPGLDDLTMSQDGKLYAAHTEGAIYRVDPDTGESCVVASGLSGGWTGPSSVRIGPDSDGWALYVTGFDGALRRLVPPVGVDLEPVSRSTV